MEINESKKKRKINDGEEENNEEADVQKFFALIDNIRDARQRLMNGSSIVLNAARMGHNDVNRSNGKKKKKVMEEEKEKEQEKAKQLFNGPAVIWKPLQIHQREDLQEEAQFKIPTSQNGRADEDGPRWRLQSSVGFSGPCSSPTHFSSASLAGASS